MDARPHSTTHARAPGQQDEGGTTAPNGTPPQVERGGGNTYIKLPELLLVKPAGPLQRAEPWGCVSNGHTGGSSKRKAPLHSGVQSRGRLLTQHPRLEEGHEVRGAMGTRGYTTAADEVPQMLTGHRVTNWREFQLHPSPATLDGISIEGGPEPAASPWKLFSTCPSCDRGKPQHVQASDCALVDRRSAYMRNEHIHCKVDAEDKSTESEWGAHRVRDTEPGHYTCEGANWPAHSTCNDSNIHMRLGGAAV